MGDLMVRPSEMGLEVSEVKAQVDKIQALMRSVMIKDVHFGTVPGTDKPTLLKAGAEKLDLTFRLIPKFSVTRHDLPGGHREYEVTCDLYYKGESFSGQGVGNCSTMETKYRYRNVADYEITGDEIPKDAKERKQEYRRQGFGMKKIGGAWEWVRYKDAERQENPDIADTYNTVLKMAKKRALVDATITACAASDIFTQDVGDPETEEEEHRPEAPHTQPPKAKRAPTLRDQIGRLVMDASGHPINGFSKDEIEKARKFCDEHQGDDIAMAAELKRLTELSAGARAALNAEASVGFGA